MRILKRIAIVLLGLVLILVVVGLFLPASYHAERSIVINAPAGVVFAYVNDLKKWEEWGPWQAEDPTIEITYGDNTVGQGASYSWRGEKSGDGHLTIVESVENSYIKTDLDFGPRGKAQGKWTFEEAEDGVKVIWGFTGDAGANLINRYLGVAIDYLVGPYFDRGLAKLKELAEAAPTPEPEQEALTDKEG